MSYISLEFFCEKYDVGDTCLVSMKTQGTLPSKIFKKGDGRLYIDESYFIRRQMFLNNCKTLAQNCTFLLEYHFRSDEIAEAILKHNGVKSTVGAIRSMADFIDGSLFSPFETKATKLKVPQRLWLAFRYAWAIERRLRRKGASIKKVLDNRTYDED